MKCQQDINNNIIEAIKNDIKYIKIESSFYLPNCIGQLTVWDVDYIFNKMDLIISFFNFLSHNWIFNLICLKENKSYIISNNTSFQVLKNKVVNYPLKSDKMVNAQINQVSLKGSNSHGYIIHQIADDNQVKKSIL